MPKIPALKGKISLKGIGLVVGILLLLASVPAGVYLAKRRQEMRRKAAGGNQCGGCSGSCSLEGQFCEECTGKGAECEVYKCVDGTWTFQYPQDPCGCCEEEPTPTPPPSCEPVLKTEAKDRKLCHHGNTAKVYVWAEREKGSGCPQASISYKWGKNENCCGDEYQDCGATCGVHHDRTGTVTIPAGQTSSSKQTVGCKVPNCGGECAACQVDVEGGWGQMAWQCPKPTPTPSPTCNCGGINIYDEEWTLLRSTKKAWDRGKKIQGGQTVNISVWGESNREITQARIRVNKGYWEDSDITRNVVPEDKDITPADTKEFYIPYTVPQGGGDYTPEAEVYCRDYGWSP